MTITIAPFYNVFGNVGPNGPNYHPDVMLVQYMLFHTMVQAQPHWTAQFGEMSRVLSTDGPDAIFPFSGDYTPSLSNWISIFQSIGNRRGLGPMTVDGTVSRAGVGRGSPSGHKPAWYTIQALNRTLYRMNRASFMVLTTLSDVPAPLATDLNTVQLDDS